MGPESNLEDEHTVWVLLAWDLQQSRESSLVLVHCGSDLLSDLQPNQHLGQKHGRVN
jgi:hypothetical protein